jgi:hypothetical protein
LYFAIHLPDTLEQADPIPCIARARNNRPKLVLKAKAKRGEEEK